MTMRTCDNCGCDLRDVQAAPGEGEVLCGPCGEAREAAARTVSCACGAWTWASERWPPADARPWKCWECSNPQPPASPSGPIRTDHFTLYLAPLPIDPPRPWQLISRVGCVLGKFSTRERGEVAINALQADLDAGTLPCDVGTWDKAHLLD